MTYIEHLDDKFLFGKFSGCTFAEVVEEYKDQITHEELGYQGMLAVQCVSFAILL